MSTPFYLPKAQQRWVFDYNGANGWQWWSKPPGASLVTLLAIGGGSAGGDGHSAAAGNNRGGAGGGGSGGVSRLVIPAMFLPGQLSILVGAGGLASGSGAGNRSYVTLRPSPTFQEDVIVLLASTPTAGSNGSAITGGAGGSSLAIAAADAAYLGLGIFTSIAGSSGLAGGTHLGGSSADLTYGISGINLSGGTGGAGVGTANTDFAAGGIIGSGLMPSIPGGATAARGNDGVALWEHFLFSGGTGGGSSGTGTGGNGGNGGPGCGGGGGGGGVTGGTGGNGGNGLVIIHVSY